MFSIVFNKHIKNCGDCESVGWEGSDDKYIIQSQSGLGVRRKPGFSQWKQTGRGVNFRYKSKSTWVSAVRWGYHLRKPRSSIES